jgi:hypothetical protein
MKSNPAASNLQALPDWSAVPSNSEDDRVFMNLRVSFFTRVTFFLSATFYIWNMLLGVRLGQPAFVYMSNQGTLLHLVATAIFGSIWFACRKGRRSARALNVLDVGGLTGAMTLYAVMVVISPPSRDQTLILTIITMACVMMHALIVPGTARRTFWVSFVACLPSVIATYLVIRAAPYQAPWTPVTSTAYNGMWAGVTVATSTLSARVIYGLSQRVREANELGQYTLEERIGEGGMGVVYRARHALLRRPTAVKLLDRGRAGERNVQRFEREVQLTSNLTHPNTIAIYDYGHTPDGIFYYAMEYLDGVTLEDLVAHDGPQSPARVVHLLRQICGALHEAHGIGLIHRDIKPANLMLCIRGAAPDQIKVLDFGLVKELQDPDGNSVAGAPPGLHLIGTPMYMAPEAINAPDRVDARTDIYALGAVAYHLLTGVPLFEGTTTIEVCMKQLHTAPVPPSSRTTRPIPSSIEALVLSCLEKDPNARPSSVAQLLTSLSRIEDVPTWTADDANQWWNARATPVRAAIETTRKVQTTAGPRTVAVRMSDRRER